MFALHYIYTHVSRFRLSSFSALKVKIEFMLCESTLIILYMYMHLAVNKSVKKNQSDELRQSQF